MCHVVHLADLPQGVMDALNDEIRVDDEPLFEADELGLGLTDWSDDTLGPYGDVTYMTPTIIQRAVDARDLHRENPPAQAV